MSAANRLRSLTAGTCGHRVAPEVPPLGQNGSPLNLSFREYVTEVSREVTERLTHLGKVVERVAAEGEKRGELIGFCPIVDCRARRLEPGI